MEQPTANQRKEAEDEQVDAEIKLLLDEMLFDTSPDEVQRLLETREG